MWSIRRTSLLATITAVAVVACQPAEDQVGEWTDDDAPRSPEVEAQIQDLRSEVEATFNELRDEIEQMRQQQVGEPEDNGLTQVSARVEETRGDVLADLERVDDMEEAHRVRDSAAERVADLEGDVVQNELQRAQDAQTLSQTAERHLSELESRLGELEGHVQRQPRDADDGDWFDDDDRDAQPRDRAATQEQDARTRQDQDAQYQERDRQDRDAGDWVRDPTGEHTLDADELDNLREDLVEARQELAQLAQEDDFESARDDLARKIADLTRDVNKHWYAMNWRVGGAA